MMKNSKFLEWMSLIPWEMELKDRKYYRHCEEVEGAYMANMLETVIHSMLVNTSNKNDEPDRISWDEISEFETVVRAETRPPTRTLLSSLISKIFGLAGK